MGNDFKTYNSAYSNFITSKVTYDIAYSKAKAGYVICENLLSDLLGLLF